MHWPCICLINKASFTHTQRKTSALAQCYSKVSECYAASTTNLILLYHPSCTNPNYQGWHLPPQSDTIRHNHHTHTFMNVLSLACLRHCYQTSSLKYVNGLDVQCVYFTAAPRTSALSHRKPTSAETSLNICVVQNGDRTNALYKKRNARYYSQDWQ